MPDTNPPNPSVSLTPSLSVTSASTLDLAAGVSVPIGALTPDPASVASLTSAISAAPLAAPAVRDSATAEIARLTRCVVPFNLNISAAAGIFLWFILFFLFADICPPYFARYVCRSCRDVGYAGWDD